MIEYERCSISQGHSWSEIRRIAFLILSHTFLIRSKNLRDGWIFDENKKGKKERKNQRRVEKVLVDELSSNFKTILPRLISSKIIPSLFIPLFRHIFIDIYLCIFQSLTMFTYPTCLEYRKSTEIWNREEIKQGKDWLYS